jgi:hypothetical protein
MKKSVLSQWFAVLLLFSALVWWASVSTREVAAMAKGKSAPGGDPTDIETVMLLWPMAVSPKRGSGREKTLAVRLFIWIS